MPIPPMVKIKTLSMPMSVCRPEENINDDAWRMISKDETGSHFEILDNTNVTGFALSDLLASEAGRHYYKFDL